MLRACSRYFLAVWLQGAASDLCSHVLPPAGGLQDPSIAHRAHVVSACIGVAANVAHDTA